MKIKIEIPTEIADKLRDLIYDTLSDTMEIIEIKNLSISLIVELETVFETEISGE